VEKKKLGKIYEKELRKNATPAEKKFKKLISMIRKQYNLAFKMQFQKGWYKDKAFFISDFYFPASSTTIELDGASHKEPTQIIQDATKSEYLSSIGVRTIRLQNADVYRLEPFGLLRFLLVNDVIKK
jgi:very-short-patch-repair endonuclease